IRVLTDVCPNIIKSDKNKINSIRLPYLDNVIVLGNDAPDFAFNWNEFITKHQDVTDDELNNLKNQLHHDDVINMQYTSGTTGRSEERRVEKESTVQRA